MANLHRLNRTQINSGGHRPEPDSRPDIIHRGSSNTFDSGIGQGLPAVAYRQVSLFARRFLWIGCPECALRLEGVEGIRSESCQLLRRLGEHEDPVTGLMPARLQCHAFGQCAEVLPESRRCVHKPGLHTRLEQQLLGKRRDGRHGRKTKRTAGFSSSLFRLRIRWRTLQCPAATFPFP